MVPGNATLTIRGCSLTSDLLHDWSDHFVYERAPFYLRSRDLTSLPVVSPLVSRMDMASDWVNLPLDARDAYTIYHVDASAEWVSLLDSASLLALDPAVRSKLLYIQWKLGRGQIYPLHVYDEMTRSDPASGLAEPFVFATDCGSMAPLQYEVWHALRPETRARWLIWYVSQDDSVCHSSGFPEEAWHHIEEICGPMPRRLAGTFSPRSGPNCFSTTLAAATPDAVVGDDVAKLWLHAEPFFEGLAHLGFRLCGSISDVSGVAARSVIVWSDASGQAQHACFVPLEEWALNKDAQGWHAPRQLLPLSDVVDAWTEPALPMHLYRPNEGPRDASS